MPLSKGFKGVILFFFILVSAAPIHAGVGDPLQAERHESYLSDLIADAIEKKLSNERYWQILLHYKKNLLGQYTSLADGPGFFLSPNGQTDPQSELEATLRMFFTDEPVGTSKQQAQCAFPARYHWLKRELNFDPQLLPEHTCERFKTWMRGLDPESVTFIFPSSYMNNPASMFGHTLIRIDQKGQTEQTRILAYAINYAADVRTNEPIARQFLGLVGGLKGSFSIMPYYLKVQQYSDMESRDIWEYRLNFNIKQIERMLMHAWELGNTYFDYYFFSENCSYHLLALLEAADPKLRLTESFRPWVIPSDTVRWITEQPGLVTEVIYRPSRTTQIQRRREQLDPAEQTGLTRLLKQPMAVHEALLTSLSLPSQARILDIAYDTFRSLEASDADNQAQYKKVKKILLETRSGLKVQNEKIEIVPFTVSPEKGHKTARVGIGVGHQAHESFYEIALRPAYHDLLDDETGYAPNAQIEIMNVRLRHDDDRTRLVELTPVRIVSLTPMDVLFKKGSWKAGAGLYTTDQKGCPACRYWNANVGIGRTLASPFLQGAVGYGFLETDWNWGSLYKNGYRIGGGTTVGLIADLIPRWRMHGGMAYLYFPWGDRSDDLRVFLHQRYTLSKDVALRFEFNRRHDQNEAVLRADFYF